MSKPVPPESGDAATVVASARAERRDFAAEPSRTLTLTDGVIAIAMTLLALDLKPPRGGLDTDALLTYFRDNAGSYLAFLLAFVLIAQYWLVHHRMMNDVAHLGMRFAWANMLFLLGIILLPVTTDLLGEDNRGPLPTTLFAADLVLISGSIALLNWIIDHYGLLRAPRTTLQRKRSAVRNVVMITIPLLVVLVTWLWRGGNANYLFFLYAAQELPGHLLTRRAQREATV